MVSNLKISNRLKSDTLWAFSAKIGTGVAQILVGMVLARILSPEEFGQYQVVQRVILFGSILGSLGMGWVIVRLVAEGLARNLPTQSYHSAKKILQITAICSAALAFFFWLFGNNLIQNTFDISISGITFIISLSLIIASFQTLIPECFRGLHDIRFASLFSGLAINSIFLILLVLVWFIYKKSSFISVVNIYFGASLIIVLFSGFILKNKLSKLDMSLESPQESYLDIVKIATPIFISTILFFIISQADVWLVAAYISNESAAVYAAASRLVFVLTVPLMVANAVIKPVVSEHWIKGEKIELEKLLRKVANITLLMSLIPSIILIVWGDWVLGMLFGDFYSKGSPILLVLILGQFIVLISGPCSVLIVMANRQKVLLKCALFGTIVFITFSIFLVKPYAELGVAFSVILGISISQLMLVYDSWKTLGIKTYIG